MKKIHYSYFWDNFSKDQRKPKIEVEEKSKFEIWLDGDKDNTTPSSVLLIRKVLLYAFVFPLIFITGIVFVIVFLNFAKKGNP